MKSRNLDKTILLLVTFILSGVVLIYIVGSNINTGSHLIDQTKLEIQSEYIRRERYQELLESYRDLVQDNALTEVTEILPSAENFIKVVEEIESIASLSDNQIQMRLGEAKLTSDGIELGADLLASKAIPGEGYYDYIEIEVTLRGGYDDLEQFIHLFNQAKYYMNINSLTVNRINTELGVVVDSHFIIQVFVQQVIYK